MTLLMTNFRRTDNPGRPPLGDTHPPRPSP
jgi:hypothetical protein